MKTLIFLLLGLGICFLRADDASQSAKWNADFDKSVEIAGKLYPDILKSDSALFVRGKQLDNVLKAQGDPLASESCKPLVIAIVTASKLNLNANWSALSDDDKYMTFLALSYAASISKDFNPPVTASSPVAPWKQGDDLGTITTTGGTVYTSAKLQSVDPDGITILDSDGGAKISFNKLSPELQKRFGYDPQQADAYAQKQAYENQIAQLSDENAKLRHALSQYKGALADAQAKPATSIAAYHCYLFRLTSGQMKGAFYLDGEVAGMNHAQAIAYAQQKWDQMPDDQKAAYERMAEETGDPIAKQEAQQGGSTTPRQPLNEDSYFLPPTTTAIDPQTGATVIIQH